jgi:hypothetical protein
VKVNPVTNYRKAKRGDVMCKDCVMYIRPFWSHGHGRCKRRYLHMAVWTGPTVCKTKTCDAAALAAGE